MVDLNVALDKIDITSSGVMGYFAKTTRSASMLNYILAMNNADRWAVDRDDNDLPNLLELQFIAKQLEEALSQNMPVIHEALNELVDVLAYLTSGRCLYIAQHIDKHNPKFMDKVIENLNNGENLTDGYAVIKRRLKAFMRAKILGEIFSAKRIVYINTIMGSYKDE